MKIFLAYAPEDESLKTELEEHLSLLKKQGIINIWHTGNLQAGDVLEEVIAQQIREAQIILLLISSDFLASDIADNPEIREALQRQQTEKSVSVIPIILRDCVWRIGDFAQLTPLPTGGKPVTVSRYWPTRDEAFKNVALGLKKVADHIAGRTNNPYPSEDIEKTTNNSLLQPSIATIVQTSQLKKIGLSVLAIFGGLALLFLTWKFLFKGTGRSELQDAFLRKSIRGTWINSNYFQSTLLIAKLQFVDNDVAVFSKEGSKEYYWGRQPLNLKDGKIRVSYDNWGIAFSIEPQVMQDPKNIISLITIYRQTNAPTGIQVVNDTLLRPELALRQQAEQVQKAIKDSLVNSRSIDTINTTTVPSKTVPPILNTSILNDSAAMVVYGSVPVETLTVSPSKMIDWGRYKETSNKLISNFSNVIESAQQTNKLSTSKQQLLINTEILKNSTRPTLGRTNGDISRDSLIENVSKIKKTRINK